MMAGCALLCWIRAKASRIGRRCLITSSLVLMLASNFVSAKAASVDEASVTVGMVSARIRVYRAPESITGERSVTIITMLFGFVRRISTNTCKAGIAA